MNDDGNDDTDSDGGYDGNGGNESQRLIDDDDNAGIENCVGRKNDVGGNEDCSVVDTTTDANHRKRKSDS